MNIGVIAGTKSSSLTSEQFDDINDGLVSIESTKLNNMSDFITIDVNHTQMRSNPEVVEQTIHFLQHGRFRHGISPFKSLKNQGHDEEGTTVI